MRHRVLLLAFLAAGSGHQAADDAAHPGLAAAGKRAVVGEGLGKAHRDTRADGGGHAYQEGVPTVLGGEGRGKQRRQGRNGAIHEAGEARLYDLENEETAAGGILFLASLGGEVLLLE